MVAVCGELQVLVAKLSDAGLAVSATVRSVQSWSGSAAADGVTAASFSAVPGVEPRTGRTWKVCIVALVRLPTVCVTVDAPLFAMDVHAP